MTSPARGVTGSVRRNAARLLLAAVALALVGYLARRAGLHRVLAVLQEAAPWLPLVVALEIVQMASDVIALLQLLRKAPPVPLGTWIKSSAAAYAMMILFPAGRASGEVTRAALLARHVGAPWATTAGSQLQASYLIANGALSAAACVAVASWAGARSPLVLLLVVNTLLMWILATAILAVLRGEWAGRFIERLRLRLVRSAAPAPALEPGARRAVPWLAAATCAVSRGAQVVQYAVLLTAVGGLASVRSAFVAHGIHLVGSTVGDVLPNQMGAVDGAYLAFAATIGFAREPARALSIAFLAHAVQLSCAAACIVLAATMATPAAGQEHVVQAKDDAKPRASATERDDSERRGI